MWRASLSKGIRELRFVLKQSPDHHGTWSFVSNKLPEIRMLNQNTFFSITEINDNFETKSAVHVIYGDLKGTTEEIETEGLKSSDIEELLKGKVEYGMGLERQEPESNLDRSLPTDIVEARKYVKHVDDGF